MDYSVLDSLSMELLSKNIGVMCHFLLRGCSWQEMKSHLHWQVDSLLLSPREALLKIAKHVVNIYCIGINTSNWQKTYFLKQVIIEKNISSIKILMSWSDCKEIFLPLYLDKLNLELKFAILVKKMLLPLLRMTFCLLHLFKLLFRVLYLFVVIHSFKRYSLENYPSSATVLGFLGI